MKNQLGLDVVGSVTFGALSEGELNLALSTALPTGLEGPELVKWAEDKIEAQEKLSAYLEEQAVFLTQPGNTSADWLIKVKTEGLENVDTGRAAVTDEATVITPTQPAVQPQIQEGATATNPTTGQRIIFTNGKWQSAP